MEYLRDTVGLFQASLKMTHHGRPRPDLWPGFQPVRTRSTNKPTVSLRFCSVRRVNVDEVSGDVASPSVAPMQDKKDLGALGTGRGVLSPKRRH